MKDLGRAIRDRFRAPAVDPDEAPDPVGVGFHGDQYLIAAADSLLAQCSHFIETGTYVGDTLGHVSGRHPGLLCISCEPSEPRYLRASEYVSGRANVDLRNITAQELLAQLEGELGDDAVPGFWLDAHGYGFEWPLREEVAWATGRFEKAHVLIDDFKVPGQPQFGFDEYARQRCAWDFIRSSLVEHDDLRVVYPAYRDRTSDHHPLRGWVAISYGFDGELPFDQELRDRLTVLTLEEADAAG